MNSPPSKHVNHDGSMLGQRLVLAGRLLNPVVTEVLCRFAPVIITSKPRRTIVGAPPRTLGRHWSTFLECLLPYTLMASRGIPVFKRCYGFPSPGAQKSVPRQAT